MNIFPKAKKTGNPELDQQAEVNHKALQKVAGILYDRPDLVLETLTKLELRVSKASVAEDTDKGAMFEQPVTTIGRIPSDWWASFCQQLSGGSLGDGLLVQVLKADTSSLDRLVQFTLQLPTSVILPAECRTKKVCARVLAERARVLNTRLCREWVNRAVKPNGDIDWAQGCQGGSATPFGRFAPLQLAVNSGVLGWAFQ